MPSASPVVRHVFGGGWATNRGLAADAVPAPDGSIVIPWLSDVQDTIFTVDGGFVKIGGASALNGTVINDPTKPRIMGMHDFWAQGTGGSPAQKLMIAAGSGVSTSLWWANVSTGVVTAVTTINLSATTIKSFLTFDDILVVMESGGNPPWSWTGSGAGQALAGSPPNASFGVVHKDRVWLSGDPADPSAVYYSAFVDPEDYTGSGSGRLVFDPNDGDAVTGLVSHKDDLWVFKGPHKGSIHRVVGSAPTGSDSFAKKPFIRGVGAVGHNTIFRFRDDIGFMWNDGSIRSLNATAAFGDFSEASLSRDIDDFMRDRVQHTIANEYWAKNFDQLGIVVMTVGLDSASNPDYYLAMDYRFEPVRWMRWPAYGSCASAIEVVIDAATREKGRLFGADEGGYVYKLLEAARSLPTGFGTEIMMKVTSPFISYGNPMQMKTLAAASVGLVPQGTFDITFRWRRDEGSFDSEIITQGGGAVLGEFILDQDVLGGSTYAERYVDLDYGGEFRLVQYELANANSEEKVEVHSLTTQFKPGSLSLENP